MVNRQHNSEKGFTLVEISIVVTIIGILMSSLILSLTYIESSANIRKTKDIMRDEIHSGITLYWAIYGRYPCPANPALGPGDTNYGYEDCSGSGIIVVDGERGDLSDADNDPDKVYIGAVPFMTLIDPDHDPSTDDSATDFIHEKDSIDSWNNKIMYAVSANLTDPATFNQHEGVIDVVDENDNSILGAEKTAHFVLFSAGEDGKGAYTREGNRVSTCSSVIETPEEDDNILTSLIDENENCDNTDAVFLSGLRNETRNNYNDDLLHVGMILNAAHWTQVGGDESTGFLITNTNPRNVGIGIEAPEEHLHISGDLKAEKVQSENFCHPNDYYSDSDDPNDLCMPTKIIAGDESDMECSGAGMAATSIEDNKVNCKQAFPDDLSTLTYTSCPSGYAVCGVSNKTGVLCRPLSGGDCKSP